jgi:hypothetical protein
MDCFVATLLAMTEDHAANQISSAALIASLIANSLGVRSAIGVRLIASFPPAGPAHLGTRVTAPAPGSGSPVPASSRAYDVDEPCGARRAIKNPPEHLAREGSHQISELSISI